MDGIESLRARLGSGSVIPACPLALDSSRRWDERRQAALIRYYLAAGAGGIAVGVHTTQFAIRDPHVELLSPLLRTVHDVAWESAGAGTVPVILIAGICGRTTQATGEARLARDLGYDAGLLSLAALRDAPEDELIAHARAVASEIPIVGFYLQPAVGGRLLSAAFWRRFAEIPDVVAIKIAPFNRYQTLDVVRAVVEAGRHDIALYTGNDDNIVPDLVTPFRFRRGEAWVERRIVGGLLGHWAVGTRAAVGLLRRCREASAPEAGVPSDLLGTGAEVTDMNAAFFDAANGFAGCIAGLHEVLRRQGLFEGIWCLDPAETLGPGQLTEIDRVCAAYPYLGDDEFVREHRDAWMR